MTIPDFQTIMLPLLEILSDGANHSNQQIAEALGNRFALTDQEMTELLPSGKQKIFINRIGWAKSFLRQGALIVSTDRGQYRITTEGQDVLSGKPEKIDVAFLMRLPTFVVKRHGKVNDDKGKENISGYNDEKPLDKTPEEYIEFGFDSIIQGLKQELLDNIKKCSFYFFEKLVIDLLLAMGYGGSRQEAGSLTRKGGDEGIDGIISEDKLGLDLIYIQAKRWDGSVSRPEIQKFAGALQGKRARKGIYITTSTFTREAHEYSQRIDIKIVLIDGNRLAELMVDHGVGVAVVQTYQLKKIDSDYFVEY